MKTPNLLITIVLVLVLYSCGKKNNTPPTPESLIPGKWTLQQEHMVISINGKTQTDTTVSTSSTTHGDINFGKSGTFTSSGIYTIATIGNLSSQPVIETDSTSGVYSFSGSQFNLSAPIAGMIFGPSAFFVSGTSGTSTLPVYTLVSHTAIISQLNQSILTLQTDFLYNETSPTAGTYENVTVYSFTR